MTNVVCCSFNNCGLISGFWKVGGLVEVFNIAGQDGRIQFDDFRLDPRVRHTVWTQIVGGELFKITTPRPMNWEERL